MPNLRSKTWTTTTPAAVEDAQFWEDHLISDSDASKIQSAVQTVNGTSPDASGNVNVVALPSGGTAGQVLTKQSAAAGDADWEDPASSGHTIKDEDGYDMPYQSTLQFLNAEVSNDSSNHKTVVDCKGAKGDPGQAATITVGTTTTLTPGSSATVSNSGTSSAAVFNFGIPKGADGVDGTDGDDGVGISSVTLLSTSGKVKTYRMTFTDSTYFDYNVTDGADGTGAGDMLSSDYDSDQAVYNAGGIAGYVSSAISGKQDTLTASTGISISSNTISIDPGSIASGVQKPVTGDAVNTALGNKQDTLTQGTGISISSNTISVDTGSVASGVTKPVTGGAVYNAIGALDGTVSGTPGAGNTLTAFSQTDGKVSATFGAISITTSQISDYSPGSTVSIAGHGTASASVTHEQQLTINSTAYDIDGTKYMEQTANSASFTFTNAAITANSVIDVYTDTWGDNPSTVTASSGSCSVTFASASTRTVRIYIR